VNPDPWVMFLHPTVELCQGHSAPRRSCGSRVYRRLSPKYIALTLGLTLRYKISKLDPTYYSCLGSYWTKDSWNATQQASNRGRGRGGGKQSGARAERAEDQYKLSCEAFLDPQGG